MLYETTMEIECKQMGMLVERGGEVFKVTKPFDMNIRFDKLNYTPLLAQSFLSPQIDPLELDISYHMHM
jgi:hypothetical protein